MYLATKVLLLLLLFFSAFALQGIGLNPIRPFHLNQGKYTSYLFSISPQQEILTKTKLKVTFPYEFDHSKLAANLQCMVKSDSYGWKYVDCLYYIDSVILTLGSIKNENTDILISKPLNPTIYTMSSYFSICLMYDNAITTCNKQFGKVIFATIPITTPATAIDPNVTSLTSSYAGQASTYQFKFSLSTTYGIGNTLRIKFPVGFTTTSSPICQMSGTFNQVIKTFVWPDNRSIECQNISKTISSGQVLKIIGIYNPKYIGTFGNTNEGFTLQILKETTTIVLEQINIQMQVTILPGTLSGRIQQENNFIKSKSKYTFYLNIQNNLNYGNYIQIRFDRSWILYSGECNVITGLNMGTNRLTCVNSTDSTYTYLKVSNFVSGSVSNQIALSIYVGSPLVTGDYTVQTITANSEGVMDKMTSKVNLNSTYGALGMLSINAITANAKIAVGATGPLQLTFFLNYPLPQTNVLTYGKFVLYIYPQIPLPSSLINGVLKCYFFNTIPAKTLQWDTSNPAYTLVTINTPETTSFQYSEIPITITTEGALNDSMIGITIANKVTRYRFELNAFTHENGTTPTEVYYTQYIADPILLSLTTYSLTNYINEATHLRFQFVGPYDFLDITQNLRLKIQFLNTGAWANNLGYDANKIYKNYPCVFSEDLGTNIDNYLSDIMCDLYTFLDGPHASLTESATRGPYLIVYGFNNSILNLSNYRLQVGNFLISQSANIQATLRFSILEQTSDMLTKYIELYYNELSVFTTVSTVKATLSSQFTTSMSTSQIELASTHTNTYTVTTNGFGIIYDYDQTSTQSFPNMMFRCSTSNLCVSLGYPLNWIIEYHSTGQFSTSIVSVYTTTNGNYAGTFSGLVRVFGSDKSIIQKSAFTYIYTPKGLNNYVFWFQQTWLYKGMESYYTVQFRTDTSIASGCFIRLTLDSGFKFGVTPYCSSSQLGLIDSKLGLLCSLQNSQSTLKIYNLNGLTANAVYQIRVRIASELTTTTGSSLRPVITIQTYLTTNIDTSVVHQLNSLSMNSAQINYYNNPISFQIDNPRVINDIPVVQYVGQFQMKFTPSTQTAASSKIRVILNNHPWNGGFWTTPNNVVTDALVCLLNGKRVACTYTLSPLNILMDVQPAGILSGSTNYITFDTEYIASQNGIKHPLNAGQYMSYLYFYDSSSNTIESNSFTHRVKARKLQNFRVLSTCHDVGVQNMFRIHIEINDSIPVNSYTNGATYSRIFIQFPTLDSLGNRLFADDLGGYTQTGQYVGCYFDTFSDSSYVSAVAGYMKCRLIKSQVYGDPVKVQIINHNYFSSSYPYMRVYIAKVFNPTIAVTSIPISIRIQHVTVSNNNVQDIYYDTYDVFMISPAAAPVLVNNTRSARGDSFQGSRNINDIAYMYLDMVKVGSVGITSGEGYYYVLDTTNAFKPRNRQANPSQYCNSSYHYECMFFPQINYLIIWSYSTNYYVSMDVYFAPAISQVTTQMVARIWQNGRLMGFDIMNYLPSNWIQLRGTILSQSFSVVGSGNSAQIGRRKQLMQVSFVLQNTLPLGGTVQIVWPSGVPAAYPHCRSMTNLGSALTAASQQYNGQIGCMVQNTRTWVITSFQALTAGATIIINGQIDLPNSYGYLGSGEIITYNNTHSTDIRTNGFIIDYVNDGNFGVYIANSNSWNFDSQITVWQTLPLRVGYVGPLQFKFQLASSLTGPYAGRISVVVNKRSTINVLSGFTYVNKKYVCKIVQILSNQQTGCTVESVTDNSTSGLQNIRFVMFTSSTLASATKYMLSITSQTGIQHQGLVFPSSPGKYQTSVSFDNTGSGTYTIYNNLYLDVYGTPFTLLKVQAWVTIPGDMNLVWIQLTPTTTIQTTQQLVVEFPTKSSAGAVLFANDLGTGLTDGSLIPVDVIDGNFDNTFMKCRLFYGDQTNSKNAKIVCGSFTQTITSSKLLFFAMKVKNPSISVQVSIPLFIYSEQIGQTYRTNFNVHENAIFINNDVFTNNYEGDIYSSSQTLQTDGSFIDLITRNVWNLQVGSAYVLYFNFPLRKNGKVANGCTYPGSSIYGDAYYHWNLWTIVCSVTSATIGVPAWYNTTQGNTRNLRIAGFYTPWYYLQASEQVITTYGYRYDWKISSRGILTDGYPNQSPKIGTSPTFLMTPLHQASKYLGSRDDYTFQITYSTVSLVDVSYTRLIAIIIPNSYSIDFVLRGQDCVEATSSDIQIQQCWIDTGSRVIWLRPVFKTSYTNTMKVRIQTRNFAIQNPVSNSSFDMNLFVVKYYSWENVTEASITMSPLSNNNYCFLMINNIASSTVSYSANPVSYPTQSFDYIQHSHQRYYEQTPFNSLSQRAPFQMIFIPHATFPTATGNNLHTIKITYPSSFGDYDMFTIRDLQIFRPVCYLANNRISRCTINTASNYIILNFQFGLTLETKYHIKVSLIDPRNPDVNGFTSAAAVSNLLVEYQISPSVTIYYMETDQFPSLYTLPSGINAGPFRGIIDGAIEYGHAMPSALNVINLRLTFNRTDITGLVFQIPLFDAAGLSLYSSNFATAFFSLENGATYPCGNNGLSAGGNVKCYILNGDNTEAGIPTRIIMTDFTYVSQMNCRFLFYNPDQTSSNYPYFSVNVKAYGGSKSASNLYGDKYMGQWSFTDIFQVVIASTAIDYNTYTRGSYRVPTQSPWRNQTTDYVFSRNQILGGSRMSIARVILYDSTLSYTDKAVCEATLGSGNDYDDMIDYTLVSGANTYKYAYYIRTWSANTNVSYTLGTGWALSYTKCKFYALSHLAYFFYSDSSIQIATNQWSTSHSGTYGAITAPTVMYFDQTYRFGDETDTYFVLQIDYTGTINSIANFQFRNGDSMLLKVFLTNNYWTSIDKCSVLGGVISTSATQLATCTWASTDTLLISNIAGFETDPLLGVTTNKRVKLMFRGTALTYLYSGDYPTRYAYSYLYANQDSYNNGYQPIFAQTSTQLLNNCYYADNNCYYAHGASNTGQFSFDVLSDTSLRVAFKPWQDLVFSTNTAHDHYYKLQFSGFGFGAGCSISSIVAQISSSKTPGSGFNNTVDPDSSACSDHSISFQWTTDRLFSDIWGGQTDTTWSTTQYVIVYIIISPGTTKDLPVYHHQYLFMTGSYNYVWSGTYYYQTRGVAYLPIQPLATSATFSTISTNRGGVTQLMIEVKGLNMDIGSANTNYLLLLEFLTTSGWTSANDPFKSYTNTVNNDEPIDCKCLSGVGPLSSSTTSPLVNAKCRRRLPTATFNNFAILIDSQASLNNDIRCYFPQFLISTGMTINAQVKVIYGDSYPPDLIGSNYYGSMLRVTSNTLTFSGSTPSMTLSGFTSFSETADIYSSAVTVGSRYLAIYGLNANWASSYSTPYVYINLRKAGPIPVFSFCSDSNVYYECRVYTTYVYLIIAKLKSTGVSSLTMTQGSQDLYYPPNQFSDSSLFGATMYVGTGDWVRSTTLTRTQSKLAPISTNSFLVMSDKYGSTRYGYDTNLLVSMSTNGQILYNYFKTGSKIQVSFLGITQKSNCQVWVQNQPIIELTCKVSANLITIYSLYFDYTPSNNIFISLGINNPNAASTTFTMKMYSNYYSASRYSLVISTTTTYAVDVSYFSNTKLAKSRVLMYPFKSRQSMVSNSPLRFRFKLSSSPGAITYGGNGRINIINNQFQYSSKFLCYFKQYTNYLNMDQQTRYQFYQAAACTSSSTTLTVLPAKTMTINPSYYYELIAMPIGITSAGCLIAGYGCQTQTGFHQDNFQDINIIAYQYWVSGQTPTVANQQVNKRYAYQGSSMIGLQYIYALSVKPSQQTSLYIAFNLNFTSTNTYPNHYIQIILWDMPVASFVGYSNNDIIPCQLSSNFPSITNRQLPQCRLGYVQSTNNILKVRIQNFGNIAVGNYWVSLDDIVLPSVSGADLTQKFDISIAFFGPSNLKYENNFKEIFIMDGNYGITIVTNSAFTFSNPTTRSYGSTTTGAVSFTWPYTTTTSGYQSKIAINMNGGYTQCWDSVDSITVSQSGVGVYLLLWVNKQLNKFVFKIPNKSNGVGTTMNINNIRNPYPYHLTNYNANGTNIQINFYQALYLQTRQVFSQPAFTYYQMNPAIIFVNQNLPTNTIDNSVTALKTASGGLSKLVLSLEFGETVPNIILKKLDLIDITFTSGLTYIDRCKLMRNNSLYTNTEITCQTYYDNSNWHVKLYEVSASQLDMGWWIQIWGTFTSATLSYKFQIMPYNLVVQYESNYSSSLSSYYSSSNTIPTVLSWMNNKYIPSFYQTQVKMLQANTAVYTPYLRFRFTVSASFDGAYGDYITISLPSNSASQPFRSKSSTTNLFCNFLPATGAQRDFSIGLYSQCTLYDTGSYLYFQVQYIRGGLTQGQDYLLQITEENIIATSFYLPTVPQRDQISVYLWRNESGTAYGHNDAFYIRTYRYFSQASILHTTTTVSDYDTLTVTYTPQGSLSAGASNREMVLRLSVYSRYLAYDGGISAIYAADGVSIQSGIQFSQVVSNPNGAQVTTVKFHQYSSTYINHLQISLAKQSAYTNGVSYTWRIPLLKNPSTAYVSLSYNLTLVEYATSTGYQNIFNKYQIINEYYTQPDTSTSFTTALTNNLRNVQLSSGVDLSIDLSGYSLNQWDTAIFKLDNSKPGLLQAFSSCNDTSNYNYYYFKILNMVLAQKKTVNSVTNIGIGAVSGSLNYESTFSFSWVKVFDSSNVQQMFNPKTLKYSVPSTLTLRSLTTYASSSLNVNQGIQVQSSQVMYTLVVRSPIVPQGGQIRVMFDDTKLTTNLLSHCRVGAGFAKSSNQNEALRCYRALNGFVIAGFSAIAVSTDLTIYFYLKSLASIAASGVWVDMFGIYRDNSTRLANATIRDLSHGAGTYPTSVGRVQQMIHTYYTSINSVNYYYQIQGSFTLRSAILNNTLDRIYMTDPFTIYGTRRLIVKKNSSTVTGWTQLDLNSCSGSRCLYYLPPSYASTDLAINTNQQYIWRYSSFNWASGNNQGWGGFLIDAYGSNRFMFQCYDGNGGNYTDVNYFQFVSDDRSSILTVSNRYPAASQQTVLDFTFSVDVDVNAGAQFQFTFDTNNLLLDMFQNDVQGAAVVNGQTYRYLDCRQWSTNSNISNSRLVCILYFGNRLAVGGPTPARLSITLGNYIDGYPSASTMRFLVANVKNPITSGMNVGVQMKLYVPCQDVLNKKCPVFSARGYYVTASSTQSTPASSATFSSNSYVVLDSSLTHSFMVPLTSSITTSSIIYIVYPQNFVGLFPTDCTASGYTCYSFPTRRWIVLYPSSTLSGSITISVYYMTNAYYSQAYSQNFKITVARSGATADVYQVLQTAFTPITSAITMMITATQTPQIWLRNYANTAIFQIDNIFMDSRIKAIYIQAPSDISQWTSTYCNATITGTLSNTYPLRFICSVFAANPQFLIITRESLEMTNYDASWASATITVHAQFTIVDFVTGQPILYATTANNTSPFYAYGSVNTTSQNPIYYLSKTSQTVPISQHQVPIISQITFNQKSFAHRVGTVNNKQVFYLLLKPIVSTPISKMVFTVPSQFDYPGVFSHDNCYMLGRTKQPQGSCRQSRQAGQTLITLTPTNYDQDVRIIQLGSKLTANWFTSPALPGDFYNMTVQLYSGSNLLLEKQTINISPVYGQYFYIPSIVLNNLKQPNYLQSIYDLSFVTGTLQIPPGGTTTATKQTSQLQFIFQNYNAAISTNVFANDLKTGLAEGDQIGCIFFGGFVALQKQRLKCILHLGKNSTDKPIIKVLGYDFINPGTTLNISFAGIQSLPAVNVNTISIAVVIYYHDEKDSSTYLYIPTPVRTVPTNATSTEYDRTFNLSGWDWAFNSSFSGVNVVLKPTQYQFSIRPPYYNNYSGFVYSSTGQQHSFILIKYTPKFVIDPYNAISITSTDCVSVFVYYATGIIRCHHTRSISGWNTWFTFTFRNFPTSAYTILNQQVSVTIQVYDQYRFITGTKTSPNALTRTIQKCTLFTFGVLSVSSLNGGQIGVSYVFSMKTNHYIPPNGAVSITIPESYGNMVTNNATCTLIGFSLTNAYCAIYTPSRIDIYLNGSQLDQNSTYTIKVDGLQNPNSNSSGLIFYVSSYFDNSIYKARKICENQITPPSINVKAIRACTLSWQPNYSNQGYNATYTFYVSCSDQFRGDSILYITLPTQFNSQNKIGNLYCTSYESSTLVNNLCTLSLINGSFVLSTSLDATSQSSLSIITNLINPVNNTYSASANIMSKGVLYASTVQQSIKILSTSYAKGGVKDVFLMNNPKEAGLMATYVFKVTPISSFIPTNMGITFPSNFYISQTDLIVGLACSTTSNLFAALNYDNIQKIINNISSVAGVSLTAYPTFTVSGNTIFLSNINGVLNSSQWTYLFVRGIKNPSKFTSVNFTLSYYVETVQYKSLTWLYSYPLTYYISTPPNYLTIQNLTVSDYDLLYPSVYTFKISSISSIAIAGKKLSYVIVLPSFYQSTLWANTAPKCKFNVLSANSTCYSYESEIIITQTFVTNETSLTISIDNILNPALQTYCNTTDVTLLGQTFFMIRIIDVDSDSFLFQSSAVVDGSNCLKFYSIRIPITLEYSLIMVAGIAYNISYGLTKPASNLKINAYIQNQTGFTFSPSMVEFNDYYTLSNSTTLYLRSDINPGTYTVKFNKYESDVKTYFRNILPIQITVIKANQSTISLPTISINSMTQSTVGYPISVPISFSLPSSTQMTLFMTISQESNQTLVQYSPYFENFTIQPRVINIQPQGSNYSFVITQLQRKVPPPLSLTFKLTSLYPIIHNLTTQTMFLCFDQDPRYNVLYPPLRVKLTPYLQSCNTKDVGKNVTNIFVSSDSSNSSASKVLPKIITVSATSISSTSVDMKISVDSKSTIYYLYQKDGYSDVNDKQKIKSGANTSGITGYVSSNPETVYASSVSQINYAATFTISNLTSTTSFNIYLFTESNLGQSQITKFSFVTTSLSKGVKMILVLTDIVQPLNIVQTLVRIMRISPLRVKVLTSVHDLLAIKNAVNIYKNTPKYNYEIVIAPDALNDVISPLNLVKNFVSNTSNLQLLKTELPQWDSTSTTNYFEIKAIKPRVTQMPKPLTIHNYNCTFTIKMWEQANIYAIIIERPQKAKNTLYLLDQVVVPILVSSLNSSQQRLSPSSNQIRNGMDVNNVQLTKYRKFYSATDTKGDGLIFFDDLTPGSIYDMYITASSILPYEPSYLWTDGQVITLKLTVLYSQAVQNQQINTQQLRKYKPSLANAIDKFLEKQNKKGQLQGAK